MVKFLKNNKEGEDLLFLFCFVLGNPELYKISLRKGTIEKALRFIGIYNTPN